MSHNFAERWGSAKGFFLLVVLLGALGWGACAVVEAPPGGAVDIVPPYLVASTPDSASVLLGPLDKFSFTFSEKMNRTGAGGWLHFYPPQKIRKTSWHGAVSAEVQLESAIPPDTVVVVEVLAEMKDSHKVSGFIERRYPIATGDRIPSGQIAGTLVMADSALAGGMVELYDVPPDTLRWDQQPVLRRARCDKVGRFALEWLPVPSGPYLLRGFADKDRNARVGDKEGQRVFPDTVSLALGAGQLVLEPLELFPVDTPGDLLLTSQRPLPIAPSFAVFGMSITTSDTGWVPVPTPFDSLSFTIFDSAFADTIKGLDSGPNRLILFADLDADSTLSVVPDSLIQDRGNTLIFALSDSLADTTGFYLEPWLGLEPVAIKPGLLNRFDLPLDPFVLVPMAKPQIIVTETSPDSLSSAAVDSASALGGEDD